MPILDEDAPKQQKQARMSDEMDKWKSGSLKSSSGQPVTKRKQAIAIALNESGQSYKSRGPKKGPRKVIKAKR